MKLFHPKNDDGRLAWIDVIFLAIGIILIVSSVAFQLDKRSKPAAPKMLTSEATLKVLCTRKTGSDKFVRQSKPK